MKEGLKEYLKGDEEAGFHTTEDGRRFFTPGMFWQKLLFLFGALAVVALGAWMAWDPVYTFLAGEKAEARVTRIIRSEPGEPDKVIRYRQEIPEGREGTSFTYFVTVELEDGTQKVMRMGVGSRRNAYANINDVFTVIYMPESDVAYGLLHHRTWAFGAGFLFTGFLLTLCAVPTLLAVGKPIEVDPEAPPEEEHGEGPDPERDPEAVEEKETKKEETTVAPKMQ